MPIIEHPEQRRLTTFAAAAMFVLAGVMTGLSASLLDIARSLGISASRAGIIYTIHFSGFVLLVGASVFAGGFGSRLRVTRLASILYVPALTAAAVSGGPVLFAAALFIAGGSGGTLESQTATIQVIAARDEAEAGAMVSVSQIFFALGALLVPLYFAVTAGRDDSWRLLFGALAVVSLLTIAAGFRVREHRFDIAPAGSGSIHWRALIRASIGLAFYVGAEVTLFGWIPTVMEYFRGIPPIRARLSPSVFWIGMLAGRLMTARLTARYRPAALLRIFSLVGVAAAVVMSLAQPEWMVWLAVVASALACAGIWPLIVATSGSSGNPAGTTITVAAGSIGAAVFPYLAGRVSELLPGTLIPLVAALLLLSVFLLNRDITTGDERD